MAKVNKDLEMRIFHQYFISSNPCGYQNFLGSRNFWFSNILDLKFCHQIKFVPTENISIFFLRLYSDVEICVKCEGMSKDISMIRKLFIATQTHSLVDGLYLYLRRLMNSHYPEVFYQWYIWCKIIWKLK